MDGLTAPMIRAYIIGESMRRGTTLADLDARLTRIDRHSVSHAASNQPKAWTTVTFETSLEPEKLAARFSEVLDDTPSLWYTHFSNGNEMFVTFPHRIFRYRVGDTAGRATAQDYARSIGVPGRQVDWDEPWHGETPPALWIYPIPSARTDRMGRSSSCPNPSEGKGHGRGESFPRTPAPQGVVR